MSDSIETFCGIVSIDREHVGALRAYLEGRERLLAVRISHLFDFRESPNTINEALQLIHKHAGKAVVWEGLVDKLNALLWDYLGVLEEGVTEFFQLIDRSMLDDWTAPFWEAVVAISETLKGHQKRLRLAIDHLEEILWAYRWVVDPQAPGNWLVRKWAQASQSLLDPSLQRELYRSHRFTVTRFSGFADRYQEYRRLAQKAEEAARKYSDFRVFQGMETSFQQHYVSVYRVLRIWGLDLQGRSQLTEALVRQMRRAGTSESVLQLFQTYFSSLCTDLFAISRRLKTGESREKAAEYLRGAFKEHHQLERVVARFRAFLLRTDPNPYVSSKWGFDEWVTGPEPEVSKRLHQLEFDLEAFEKVYELFLDALEHREARVSCQSEIERLLHQMNEPGISRHAMQTHAENLVGQVQGLNELGSTEADVIDNVGEILIQAMRADWVYGVLWTLPEFHKAVKIHWQLADLPTEILLGYTKRSMQSQMQQIFQWISRGHIEKHIAEVDLFIEEVKNYLKGQPSSKALLAVIYQLGRFLHDLEQAGPFGATIRAQLALVEQRPTAAKSDE